MRVVPSVRGFGHLDRALDGCGSSLRARWLMSAGHGDSPRKGMPAEAFAQGQRSAPTRRTRDLSSAHMPASAPGASAPNAPGSLGHEPGDARGDATGQAASQGLLAGFLAFMIWGVLPIYWRGLGAVPALELVMHRAVWGAVFFVLALSLRRAWPLVHALRTRRRQLAALALTASLLGLNFFTFVYGVESGRVVEVSLGYFLNPVLNVLLGVVVLRERLTRAGSCALALAAGGVVVMASSGPSWPWISLVLAGAFASYGLVRKQLAISAWVGNAVEMLLLAIPCAGGLLWLHATSSGHWGPADLQLRLLLTTTGIVTAVPLLLFTVAARRLRLSTLGFMQYLAPSIQLAIAVWVFGEEFSVAHMVAFAMIWCALAVFAGERSREHRRQRGAAASKR